MKHYRKSSLSHTCLSSRDRMVRNLVWLSCWLLTFVLAPVHAQEAENTANGKKEDSQQEVVVQWPETSLVEFAKSVNDWYKTTENPSLSQADFETRLDALISAKTDLHAEFIKLLRESNAQSQSWMNSIKKDQSNSQVPDLKNRWVNSHLQLWLAIRQTKANQHDEAQSTLLQIDPSNLIDPSTFYFYQAVTEFQLVQVDQAKATLRSLILHEEKTPTRYASLAKLMMADLESYKPDSLQEVSKLMSDASRRQKLERHTEKVLTQEKEIVEKLDKVIEDLEKQQQQMQVASQSKPQQSRPQQKSDDQSQSQPQAAGNPFKGDVDSKGATDDGDWGDIDQNQKSIAVNNLIRDLPPHFRTLVEAYFQKLAEEKDE